MIRDRSGLLVCVLADQNSSTESDMTKSVLNLFGFSVTADLNCDCVLVLADTPTELEKLNISALPKEKTVLLSAASDVLALADELGFASLKRPFAFEALEDSVLAAISNNREKRDLLSVLPDKGLAYSAEKSVKLTPLEAKLLAVLVSADGGTVSRDSLLTLLGGATVSNKLDVHLCALRRKLRDSFNIELITVRGEGWKLCH